MNENRICIECHNSKPLTLEYFKTARWYKGKQYFTHKCRVCSASKSNEVSKKYQRNHSDRQWVTKTVSCAMKRARDNNVPFDREYVKQMAKNYKHGSLCPSCQIVMSYFNVDNNNHNKRKTWVSLDRIYPEKGYMKDNLCFICHRCNWLKSNATIDELENVVGYMRRMIDHA